MPKGNLAEYRKISLESYERDRRFTLQWHLTAKCNYRCFHCYVHDASTYMRELKNELGFDDCLAIIDEFSVMVSDMGVPARINFTGGDPLLKERIIDIIRYARAKGLEVGILGNPDTLTEKIAEDLSNLHIRSYQISIDGMEATHDALRGKDGAFRDAIRAIRILNRFGIPSVVMFTLSKKNASELVDVIKLVDREHVSVFDFARLVPIGSGRMMRELLIDARSYRELLLEVLEQYKKLRDAGSTTKYGRKESLWALLYSEIGIHNDSGSNEDMIMTGCALGCNIMTILADGTALGCRRLPIKIGKVPEQKLREIFIKSYEHQRMRKVEDIKKCGKCDLLRFCRGCRAVAFAVNGEYLGEDPQCWRKTKDVNKGRNAHT
ncbi:MAG: radical SAM protein [Thermoplasmata archaeon]